MTLNLLMVLTLRWGLVAASSTGDEVTGAGTGIGIGLLDRLTVGSYRAVGVVEPLEEGDRAIGIEPRRPAKGRVSETLRPAFWLTKVMVLPRSRGGSWGGVVDLDLGIVVAATAGAGMGKVFDARDRGEAEKVGTGGLEADTGDRGEEMFRGEYCCCCCC